MQDSPSDSPQERLLTCYQQALGHELPNQLVAIQGIVRILEEDEEQLSESSRPWLHRLTQIIERAFKLSQQVAELGKALRHPKITETVPLDQIWDEVLIELRVLVPDRTYHSTVNTTLPELQCSHYCVHRVMLELLLFSARRIEKDQQLTLAISATKADNNQWSICLSCDGPLLCSAEKRLLFHPFSTINQDDSPDLGLFLSQLLVEGWGGELRLQSRPDSGFESIFSLPTLVPQPHL